MKANELMNKANSIFKMSGLKLRKHSPEILIVAGVVGTVVSTVMACKATTKINDILDESKAELEKVHEWKDKGDSKYTQDDAKKDTTIIYTQTGLKLAKLYAPSIILGTLSITSIITSNHILRKRNVAITAAYATLDRTFKDYRRRVVDKFGDEVDKQMRYGIKAVQIEETVEDENGKKKKVKKNLDVTEADLNEYSDYARFFDEGCNGWTKDSEYNLTYLKGVQRHANNCLVANGFLFLNEVYEMLGIPKTKAGQVVGWIYDKNNPVGDNYVDFGIYDLNKVRGRDFVNGYERTILLDFNVDGNILDMI